MAAWFNKKTVEAMAKMAESLKAESMARAQAEEKLRIELESRAAMERKVKAEAEKLLLDQYNKYNAMVERAEAKAKEAMLTSEAQVKESEDRVNYYAAALAEAEEKLSEAKERIKIEAVARVRAEERLKSEVEERKRLETQLKDAVAAAEAKEEEKIHSHEAALAEAQKKVQSYEAALAKTQEKLIEAKEQARAKTVAKAKHGPKAGIKERQRLMALSVDGASGGRRNHWGVFHPGNIKRKFILLLVLVIFSALTFGLNVTDEPSSPESDGAMIQEQTPAPADMTHASELNYISEDNVTLTVNEGKSVPISDIQSLTLTASPVSLKLTASEGDTNNVVQYSDNNRWETGVGSDVSYEFSGISVPANAVIKSVVLFVEHFEEERFAKGKLELSIGTGWPGRPVVWAVMKAPVHEGESNEAVDAWDITSVVNTAERINSLQLQVKNNNNVANGKTFVDYAYVVIKYH